MLNRREFLGSLLGAAAAAAILPRVERLIGPLISASREVRDHAHWQNAYQVIHHHAFSRFKQEMARNGLPVDGRRCASQSRIGDHALIVGESTAPVLLEHGVGIAFSEEELQLALHKGVLDAAMASLAERVSRLGIDTYGQPELPKALSYAGNHGPLRMVVGFDIVNHHGFVRFDLIGGASPAGARIGRQLRAEDTKKRIRWNISHAYLHNRERFPA